MPSLSTLPNAAHTFANASASLSARFCSSATTRPMRALRMSSTCGLFCSISREMDLFRGAVLAQRLDGELDVVRVGLDDALDVVAFEIALRILLEMQHDLGAARHAQGFLLGRRRDLEARLAGVTPNPGFARAR